MKKNQDKNIIRIGIIGTGSMAGYHVDAFNKIKSCEIVACCDVDEEKVKNFAEKYNIKNAFTDIDEMFENIELDAVSVVTPDRFHKEVSLKCINKGLHVLCEKPLAVNEKDAKQMLLSAKKKGIVTFVNFTYRNYPSVQRAHELISEGKLGEIIHLEASYLQSWLLSKNWGDWRKNPSLLWRLSKKHYSQGVLGDIGVHIYYLASFIVGDFGEINCKLKIFDKGIKKIDDYVFDVNDSFVSTIKFKNGALGTIHSTRCAIGNINSIRIKVFGDKGAIEIDTDKSNDNIRVCMGKNIDNAVWEEIKCPGIPNIHERFIKSIETGKQDKPDFEDGLKIQGYIDKSFLSDKFGKWVKV